MSARSLYFAPLDGKPELYTCIFDGERVKEIRVNGRVLAQADIAKPWAEPEHPANPLDDLEKLFGRSR